MIWTRIAFAKAIIKMIGRAGVAVSANVKNGTACWHPWHVTTRNMITRPVLERAFAKQTFFQNRQLEHLKTPTYVSNLNWHSKFLDHLQCTITVPTTQKLLLNLNIIVSVEETRNSLSRLQPASRPQSHTKKYGKQTESQHGMPYPATWVNLRR